MSDDRAQESEEYRGFAIAPLDLGRYIGRLQ